MSDKITCSRCGREFSDSDSADQWDTVSKNGYLCPEHRETPRTERFIAPEGLLGKKMLLRRGWNQRLITQLLGEPDEILPAQQGQQFEMQGYKLDRVLAAEASPEFTDWQQSPDRKVRKDQARLREDTKRLRDFVVRSFRGQMRLSENELADLVRHPLAARLPDFTPQDLRRAAVKHLYTSIVADDYMLKRMEAELPPGYVDQRVHIWKLLAIAQEYPALEYEAKGLNIQGGWALSDLPD